MQLMKLTYLRHDGITECKFYPDVTKLADESERDHVLAESIEDFIGSIEQRDAGRLMIEYNLKGPGPSESIVVDVPLGKSLNKTVDEVLSNIWNGVTSPWQ